MISSIIRLILFICMFFSYGYIAIGQSEIYLTGILIEGKSNAGAFKLDNAGNLNMTDWFSPRHFHNTISGVIDESGIPILYTNGCFIFDRFHNPIHPNSLLEGTDLNIFCEQHGSILNNSAQLLKTFSDANEFLLVFSSGNYKINGIATNNFLGLAKVNINSNELSDIEPIYASTRISDFDVTTHLNGRDYWVATADLENSTIIISHLSDRSAVEQQSIPFEFFNLSEFCSQHIQIEYSNEGNTLMVFSGKCFLALFDFDRCSGLLSNMRINIGINSNILGKSAAFTADDKFIYVEKEFYRIVYEDRAYFSQIELYETSKVGVKISPDAILEMPEFYSKGRMIQYSERSMLIFNQFGSKSYINIGITDNNMDTSQISRIYEKSPYYLLPAISKKVLNLEGINRCINSVTDFSHLNIMIYPNPAQNYLKIELPEEFQLQGLGASIYGADGKIALNITIQDHKSSIDISNFQAGTYIIVIQDPTKMYSANKISLIK